jgi:hypothetical protein
MAKLLGSLAPVLVIPMTPLLSGSSIPLGLDTHSQRDAATLEEARFISSLVTS